VVDAVELPEIFSLRFAAVVVGCDPQVAVFAKKPLDGRALPLSQRVTRPYRERGRTRDPAPGRFASGRRPTG
jgi:hypothetical protein